MIVTFQHYRTIPHRGGKRGHCVEMGKLRFKRYGLDWRDFVRNGIDSSKLLETGDGQCLALVEWAERCESEANALEKSSG